MAIVKMRVAVDVSGLRELSSDARKRTVTTRMVRAGGRVVQRAAKARAPRRKGSGALRQSLGVKAARGKRGQTISYAVVGPRKKVAKTITSPLTGKSIRVVPAFYAHLVELGTRPHALVSGARLAGRGKAAVGQFVGRARHPGSRPEPFLRPALEGNTQAIADAMLSTASAEIKKELEKAARKTAKGKR